MAPPEPMSHREVRHRQARAIQRGMPRNSWMPVARLSLRQRSPGSLAEGRECLAAFFPVVLQSMSVLRGLCRQVVGVSPQLLKGWMCWRTCER